MSVILAKDTSINEMSVDEQNANFQPTLTAQITRKIQRLTNLNLRNFYEKYPYNSMKIVQWTRRDSTEQ